MYVSIDIWPHTLSWLCTHTKFKRQFNSEQWQVIFRPKEASFKETPVAIHFKVKIKRQSYPCNRPSRTIRLCDVEAPILSIQSTHRWLWACQPYAPAAFLPPGRFLVLISVRGWLDLRAIVQLEGLGQLKNTVISSGIKLATFRLVE
jgi:hypothetical protein